MKRRKTLWSLCVLMLCLCSGWQSFVGPRGVRLGPNGARSWQSAAQPQVRRAERAHPGMQISNQGHESDPGALPAGKAAATYARLPLSFEANHGQTDQSVKFLARGRGYDLFLTGDEAVLELQESGVRSQESGAERARIEAIGALRPQTGNEPRTRNLRPRANCVLRLQLVNARQGAAITGAHQLPGKVNYFLGNDPKKWRTDVPAYAEVRYQNVYPGVNLVYYGNQGGHLEYDFVVAPGADPSAISVAVDAPAPEVSWQKAGSSGQPKIASNGDLVMRMDGDDEVRFHKPLVYQEQESEVRIQESGAKNPRQGAANNRKSPLTNRKSVEGRFTLDAQNRVHFAIGPYDHNRALVIDPVLVYSTFLGGSGIDSGSGIAVDSSGHVYVTGYTQSANFPTAGPLQAGPEETGAPSWPS